MQACTLNPCDFRLSLPYPTPLLNKLNTEKQLTSAVVCRLSAKTLSTKRGRNEGKGLGSGKEKGGGKGRDGEGRILRVGRKGKIREQEWERGKEKERLTRNRRGYWSKEVRREERTEEKTKVRYILIVQYYVPYFQVHKTLFFKRNAKRILHLM